ncbi:MAG: ribosome small subunit-dependent GTPase A [Clostridiales bacterium]|nr:ribosome small subunit-dependent GTPase A [Clostridiales bacterium]MBQ3322902.1 ribosome small subunit-dependent GTPase A [Bacillota bacterium]
MRGTIIKGIAGFYYVKSGETVYRCRAKGTFKEKGIKPAVGDEVRFQVGTEEDNTLVTEILPRKNVFIRPFVSNVDCFVIVAAAKKPAPILQTIDRFLVMAEKAQTDIVFCINKCDLKGKQDELKEIYESLYPTVCIGQGMEEGLEELKQLIKGKKAALAGASGVGKSTILNRLHPEAQMETGNISRKSQRGKHTTRHSELFTLDEEGTMIFDTPGFTSFDILTAEVDELQFLYPEIGAFAGRCRYDNCRHLAEPECAVKQALEEGRISASRYRSYKEQMEELLK